MRLHHVQLSCPEGGEEAARRFWVEGLGLAEVAKPSALAGRGGAWFRGEAVEVHVGVEEPFAPARRAHPALVLGDAEALRRAAGRLQELGFEVDWTERTTFPGHQRCHARDGHGNRVELLAPTTGP
ncbi:VOC family protein [uncultured Nocardioides sp.]|jgi:catechol 2,3-dioxygenase-like lactoylglutathione lyase family enzyme|uniref:VOC family protein n=1 Tax=uncultured Nocardioides sp. TaxID=198441 RepID=UPI000C6BC587|nr:VOC family protein [uncultured Nocardioides sp.]MAO80015.1 glyoxalase [Nocardioides sp.]